MTNWKADPKVAAARRSVIVAAGNAMKGEEEHYDEMFIQSLDALCEAVAASGSPPSPLDDPARVLEAVRQMGASSPWHKDQDVLCVPGPVAREVFNAAYNYHEPIGEILNRAAREVQPLIDKEREGIYADGETLNMRFGASSGSTGAPLDQPTPEDTKRLDHLEAWLDGFEWVHLPTQIEPEVRCDWFAGDGSGHWFTQGKTFREAIDKSLNHEATQESHD